MALFNERTQWCAHIVLDMADIVREAIYVNYRLSSLGDSGGTISTSQKEPQVHQENDSLGMPLGHGPIGVQNLGSERSRIKRRTLDWKACRAIPSARNG